MNETVFGLDRIPFTALPLGADVFFGPQTAALVEALRPALNPRGAIAVVTGPAGAGKTTSVTYALDTLYRDKKIVRVGRTPLQARNVLESLLIVLGVENRPPERDRRRVILRDALRQYEAAGIRVVVVVEDALASGEEVLAEIAALSAPQAGESGGARIVLMGSTSLPEFLQRPSLADLQARISLHHGLDTLTAAETHGYLMHCFRNAGGDFNRLFKPGCSALLQKICDGNPRAINQLAEVVLRTADELNVKRISTRYIANVAVQIYDPEIHDFSFAVSHSRDAAITDNAGSEGADPVDEKVARIKEDIARAECLEDLDDLTAETLFGAEIADPAAKAVAGNK